MKVPSRSGTTNRLLRARPEFQPPQSRPPGNEPDHRGALGDGQFRLPRFRISLDATFCAARRIRATRLRDRSGANGYAALHAGPVPAGRGAQLTERPGPLMENVDVFAVATRRGQYRRRDHRRNRRRWRSARSGSRPSRKTSKLSESEKAAIAKVVPTEAKLQLRRGRLRRAREADRPAGPGQSFRSRRTGPRDFKPRLGVRDRPRAARHEDRRRSRSR